MKRLAQAFLVVAALGLLAGLAASIAPAGRSDDSVIAGGVIVDTNEDGLDGQVLVYAPPVGGGAGKMRLVASQQVEGGGFSMTASNSEALARLQKANGGYANLEFVAVGGGFFASRTMPRGFSDGDWSDRDGSNSLGEVILARALPARGRSASTPGRLRRRRSAPSSGRRSGPRSSDRR